MGESKGHKLVMMNKRTVAREWLYFVGLWFFGIFALPPFVASILGKGMREFYIGEESFYFGLIGAGGLKLAIVLWIYTLSPYLVVQFVRSIIKAVKTLRRG